MCKHYGIECENLEFKSFNDYISTAAALEYFNIRVYTLDYSDFEGADYIYDLNEGDISLENTYDIVLDGGTLEHVFHWCTLTIPTNLTKVGGLTIHLIQLQIMLTMAFTLFANFIKIIIVIMVTKH